MQQKCGHKTHCWHCKDGLLVEAVGPGSKWWSQMCFNTLHAFVWIISYLSHSNRACPICDVNSLDSSLLAHTLSTHVTCWYQQWRFRHSWLSMGFSFDPSFQSECSRFWSWYKLYKFYRLYEHCKRPVYYRSRPIIIKLWLLTQIFPIF